MDDFIGKMVVARTGTGQVQAIGICRAACDAPTLQITELDGRIVHWRADMCKVVDLADDELKYIKMGGQLPMQKVV